MIIQKQDIQLKHHKFDQINVYALGGMQEVGKNMYCIESASEVIIIDCGAMFIHDKNLGVDAIVPSVQHLANLDKDKKIHIIITHGHEDHIGAIPYALKNLKVASIHAPLFASELIKTKFTKHQPKIQLIDEKSIVKTDTFKIQFFYQTHSIPDAFGVIVDTKHGRIVSTGDFKIDLTPPGHKAGLAKMASIGYEGVELLLSDSTNSHVAGYSASESSVRNNINGILARAKQRIIVTTFASNVHRLNEIIKVAVKSQRKIVIVGRSLQKAINIALKLKYIDVSKTSFLNIDAVRGANNHNLLVLCTGSQGEPLSALTKIAFGKHKHINLQPGDTIVFSSNPIPGNFLQCEAIINKLIKKGAKVIVNNEFFGVHTSGHANQLEQKLMLNLIKPKFFLPMHGSYSMLRAHRASAIECGVPDDQIFILANGEQLILKDKVVTMANKSVISGNVYFDNDHNIVHSGEIIDERKIMQQSGTVVANIVIDQNNAQCQLTYECRGLNFQFDEINFNKIKTNIYDSWKQSMDQQKLDQVIQQDITNILKSRIFDLIKTNPLVLVSILT